MVCFIGSTGFCTLRAVAWYADFHLISCDKISWLAITHKLSGDDNVLVLPYELILLVGAHWLILFRWLTDITCLNSFSEPIFPRQKGSPRRVCDSGEALL